MNLSNVLIRMKVSQELVPSHATSEQRIDAVQGESEFDLRPLLIELLDAELNTTCSANLPNGTLLLRVLRPRIVYITATEPLQLVGYFSTTFRLPIRNAPPTPRGDLKPLAGVLIIRREWQCLHHGGVERGLWIRQTHLECRPVMMEDKEPLDRSEISPFECHGPDLAKMCEALDRACREVRGESIGAGEFVQLQGLRGHGEKPPLPLIWEYDSPNPSPFLIHENAKPIDRLKIYLFKRDKRYSEIYGQLPCSGAVDSHDFELLMNQFAEELQSTGNLNKFISPGK